MEDWQRGRDGSRDTGHALHRHGGSPLHTLEYSPGYRSCREYFYAWLYRSQLSHPFSFRCCGNHFGCRSSVCRSAFQLNASERRFRGLLEAAPDAILVVNDAGKIVLANAQAEKLFGYSREELLGHPLEMLVPERFRKKHPRTSNSLLQRSSSATHGSRLELYGLHKNGQEFPVEISLSPLQTAEGVLVTSAIRDITERKRAELRLARAVRPVAAFAR